MAMQTRTVIYGVDVSQQWLDVCRHGEAETRRLANAKRDVNHWLKSLPPGSTALAVEATNTYHELLVAQARHFGLTVYLISGYQLKHYARSLNVRMRTDAVDARLLARFLEREIDDLRPYEPPSPRQRRLLQLLRRRALLVKQIQQLRQSFAGVAELSRSVNSVIHRQQHLIALIDKRLHELACELRWNSDLRHLRSLPGVGPLNALALCAAFRSGEFAHRDPFVAFLGLDVRTKDSGKHRGRRKLTKKGCPEFRRLLYNAAMAATREQAYFHGYYLSLQTRGLTKTAALVVVSRRIARLAFALLKNHTSFDPKLHREACSTT